MKDESKAILTKQVQYFSDIEIPVFLRPHLYGIFARHYQVNTDEIELPLKDYPTFSSFFIRRVRRQH
jgi:phosphatidylserine decarboxylase